MSNRMIIIAPEPENFTVSLEQFQAGVDYWRPFARLGGSSPESPADATISVDRPNEPGFLINHFRDASMLSTDGTADQAAEVAVWVANTFPMTGPGELWMVDQGYSGHVVLRSGMSVADVLSGWQDHE